MSAAEKPYEVLISDPAEADLDNIYNYIAFEKENPLDAIRIVDHLYTAIEELTELPKRHPVIAREPWKARGVRFMYVGNYRVHYVVFEDERIVKVFNVMYARRDS